jgi:hypothetical protein
MKFLPGSKRKGIGFPAWVKSLVSVRVGVGPHGTSERHVDVVEVLNWIAQAMLVEHATHTVCDELFAPVVPPGPELDRLPAVAARNWFGCGIRQERLSGQVGLGGVGRSAVRPNRLDAARHSLGRQRHDLFVDGTSSGGSPAVAAASSGKVRASEQWPKDAPHLAQRRHLQVLYRPSRITALASSGRLR